MTWCCCSRRSRWGAGRLRCDCVIGRLSKQHDAWSSFDRMEPLFGQTGDIRVDAQGGVQPVPGWKVLRIATHSQNQLALPPKMPGVPKLQTETNFSVHQMEESHLQRGRSMCRQRLSPGRTSRRARAVEVARPVGVAQPIVRCCRIILLRLYPGRRAPRLSDAIHPPQ